MGVNLIWLTDWVKCGLPYENIIYLVLWFTQRRKVCLFKVFIDQTHLYSVRLKFGSQSSCGWKHEIDETEPAFVEYRFKPDHCPDIERVVYFTHT